MHLIQRQTFELTLPSGDGAPALQEEVRRIHHSRLLPAMETLFSSLAADGEVVRLDRVEIELGSISADRLEEQLVNRLRRRLREILDEQIGELRESAGRGRIMAPQQARLEALRTFLLTGSLPWWEAQASRFDPEEALAEMIRTASQPLARMLREISGPRASKRFVKQLSPGLRRKVLTLLAPSVDVQLEKAMESWVVLLSPPEAVDVAGGSVFPDRRKAQRFVQEQTFLFLSGRRSWASPVSALLSDHLLEQTAQLGKLQEIPAALELIRRARIVLPPDSPVRNRLLERFASTRPAAPVTRAKTATGTWSGETAKPLDREAGDLEATNVQPSTRKRPSSKRRTGQALPEAQAARGRPSQSDPGQSAEGTPPQPSPTLKPSLPLPQAEAEPDASNQLRQAEPTTGQSLYVDNAGLVLLWPFLRPFFEKVDLVEAKAFRSQAAQERAVLLLHYLATGECEVFEHLLTLNKLLCGWPIAEPVEKEFEPTPDEERESEDVLASAVAGWKILKNTSTEGFRASFLRRDGRLERDDSGWRLQVARTGYDVLLDQLPWGIGFVLLPWMEAPLFVEW